jgi:hypothetical protein
VVRQKRKIRLCFTHKLNIFKTTGEFNLKWRFLVGFGHMQPQPQRCDISFPTLASQGPVQTALELTTMAGLGPLKAKCKEISGLLRPKWECSYKIHFSLTNNF